MWSMIAAAASRFVFRFRQNESTPEDNFDGELQALRNEVRGHVKPAYEKGKSSVAKTVVTLPRRRSVGV